MPLTKEQKEKRVVEVQEGVAAATAAVFVSYDGLTVDDMNELRANIHDQGGKMRVVPKRLLKIALQGAKVDFDPTEHDGQLAAVWADDAVAPAKVISEFAKEHVENIKLLAGTLEGGTLTLEEVTSLAKLPTREQLIGQLLSVIAGPSRGLVTVLSGVQRNTVQVLQAIADQKA